MKTEKLGIIVPYIKNEKLLNIFILYMNNFMKHNYSHIDYEMIIVEQKNSEDVFKKGFLINVGFDLCKKYINYINIQDLNLLPISINYKFPDNPLLLSCNIYENNKTGYFFNSSTLNCSMLMKKNDFLQINGANNNSNEFVYEDINNRLKIVKNELIKHLIRNQSKQLIPMGNYIELKYNEIKLSNLNKDDILKINYSKNGLSTLKYKIFNKEINVEKNYIKYIIC